MPVRQDGLKLKVRRNHRRSHQEVHCPGGRSPEITSHHVLRVGADCAGLNLACVALELLNVKPELEYASEKDRATRAMLVNNFEISTSRFYGNIQDRDHTELPSVDLYTAGPPCQSFSAEGKNLGLADPNGVVFLAVLQTINETRPSTFVIENVAGLMHRHRVTFKAILYFLQHISEEDGTKTYKVRAALLNSLDIGGVPQSRQRVYIVGWKRAKQCRNFSWPDPIPPQSMNSVLRRSTSSMGDLQCTPLGMGPAHIRRRLASGLRNLLCKHPTTSQIFSFELSPRVPLVLVNVHSSEYRGGGSIYINQCPCLTGSACRRASPWILNLNRPLSVAEIETLQGIPDGRLKRPKGVTYTQHRGMIGNGFTVGVVGRIALRLLQTVGLLPSEWPDIWENHANGG